MEDRNGTDHVNNATFSATADVFVPAARKSNVVDSGAGTTTSHDLRLGLVPRPPYAGYIGKPMSISAPPELLHPTKTGTRKYVPNRNTRRGGRKKEESPRLFGKDKRYRIKPPTVQRPPSLAKVRSYPDLDGMLHGISPPNLEDQEPFREQLEIISRHVALMGRYSQPEISRRASDLVDTPQT
jgi:hypothetical protein